MTLDLPRIGVGIGWREAIAEDVLHHIDGVDWCELISEHFIDAPESRLDEVRQLSRRLPLIPHGVDMSIGSDSALDQSYLHNLGRLIDAVQPPWFTDHLCFTRAPGFNLGQLGPLPFTHEAVDVVCRNVRALKEVIPLPFLLENITYDFIVPGAELTEAEFISRILLESDIGLLLDVTNLHINSHNHNYEPHRFLAALPVERVVQLHVAGGQYVDGRWLDSHSHPIPEEVFALTDYIVKRAPVKAILLERDTNFPEQFGELVDELARARGIMTRHHGALSSH